MSFLRKQESRKPNYALSPISRGQVYWIPHQVRNDIKGVSQFKNLKIFKKEKSRLAGKEGEMRRIIFFTVLITIFVLLTACTGKPRLPEKKINAMAHVYCQYAAEEYYRRHYLNVNKVPINLKKVEYKILKFNRKNNSWPLQVSCDVEIGPLQDIAGFKVHVDAGAIIYRDDFERYSSEFAYSELKVEG